MPESIEISDVESNFNVSYYRDHELDRGNTRETRNHVDAPPSYHEATASDPLPEATASAPPLETLFPATPESSSLPSYDEFLANETRYVKKS